MKTAISTIKINDNVRTVKVEADDIAYGNDEIWFNRDNPPGSEAMWVKEGYTVQPFLSPEDHLKIREAATKGIANKLTGLGLGVDTKGFTLEKYHEYVNDEQHLAFIENIRAGGEGTGGLSFELLPVLLEFIEQRVSQICNTEVTAIKTFLMENGSYYTTRHFWLRVIRPQCFKDNNLPHKDVHLDRGNLEGKKAINLYLPLAGSNELSSLPIIPGSHLWPENEIERTFGKVYCDGVQYTNPAIVSTKHGLDLITPNPGLNEAMIFTPYAIHGGGFNFNTDKTRVSLEMRFWRP